MLAVLVLLGAAHAGAGARIGVDTGAVRDDLVVPLGFGGGGIHVGGAASTRVASGLLDLRLDVGLRLLATRYGQIAFSGAHRADARWLTSVTPTFAVGPAVLWDSRMDYLESWDDAHGYGFGSQWIGPACRWVIERSDGRPIELAAAFALVGAVGRPEDAPPLEKQDPLKRPSYWLVGPTENERWVTLATFQAVRVDAMLGGDAEHRWAYGLDTHLVRTTESAVAVDVGAALWLGRTWGRR
jgi:hypothetical protein